MIIMTKLLQYGGAAVAVLGILVCLITGVLRLMGHYNVLGYETMTLFISGIALMVAACAVKLYLPNGH